MKKLLPIVLGFLLIVGCATAQPDKYRELEKRIEQVEMMIGAGVGANFYPFRCMSGGVAGCLDALDGASLSGDDVAFVILEDSGTYGDSVFIYVLDADANCGGDDAPWYIIPDSNPGTKCWELVDIYGEDVYGRMYVSMETGATVTVLDYESGTHFINGDNDAIEFDLPSNPTNLIFCFGNDQDSTAAITIDPDASDYIVLDGTTAAQGEAIVSAGSSSEENVCLIGLDGSYWKVTGYQGTWAEETP